MYIDLKESRPHGTKDYPYTQYHIHRFTHEFQIPVHWHDEVEIIFIRKGPLSIAINGEEYIGNAKDIFIVSPGQLHLMGSKTASVDYFTLLFPLEFISFQTKDLLEEELLFPLRNHSLAFPTTLPQDDVLSDAGLLLEKLIDLNKSESPHRQIGTRILLLQFIQLLTDHSLLCHQNSGSSLGIQKELITYIQQNYCRPITLAELAERFHLSEKYISRYFKEHFHLPMSQYTNYLRLSHARHLLETTSLPITEVALHSGFSNVSYFIRAFKASYGVSPLKYRNTLS